MNGDYEVWIISGHHDAYQITADVAKIAGVTKLISVRLRWIQNHGNDLALSPALPAHFVSCMVTELHARLRAWRGILTRLGARNADFEVTAVDRGGGAVSGTLVGDGDGQYLTRQVVLVGLSGLEETRVAGEG
jgi:hypothetical protein